MTKKLLEMSQRIYRGLSISLLVAYPATLWADDGAANDRESKPWANVVSEQPPSSISSPATEQEAGHISGENLETIWERIQTNDDFILLDEQIQNNDDRLAAAESRVITLETKIENAWVEINTQDAASETLTGSPFDFGSWEPAITNQTSNFTQTRSYKQEVQEEHLVQEMNTYTGEVRDSSKSEVQTVVREYDENREVIVASNSDGSGSGWSNWEIAGEMYKRNIHYIDSRNDNLIESKSETMIFDPKVAWTYSCKEFPADGTIEITDDMILSAPSGYPVMTNVYVVWKGDALAKLQPIEKVGTYGGTTQIAATEWPSKKMGTAVANDVPSVEVVEGTKKADRLEVGDTFTLANPPLNNAYGYRNPYDRRTYELSLNGEHVAHFVAYGSDAHEAVSPAVGSDYLKIILDANIERMKLCTSSSIAYKRYSGSIFKGQYAAPSYELESIQNATNFPENQLYDNTDSWKSYKLWGQYKHWWASGEITKWVYGGSETYKQITTLNDYQKAFQYQVLTAAPPESELLVE